MELLFVVLAAFAWFAVANLGAYVSHQKGRGPGEGFVMSLIFGPLGVIAVGLLPNRDVEDDEEDDDED